MPYLKIISYEVKSSNAGVSNLAISFWSLDQVFKNDYLHVKKKKMRDFIYTNIMHGFKHIRSKRDEIKPTSSTSKRERRCKLRNLCLILVEFSYNKNMFKSMVLTLVIADSLPRPQGCISSLAWSRRPSLGWNCRFQCVCIRPILVFLRMENKLTEKLTQSWFDVNKRKYTSLIWKVFYFENTC